MGVKKVVELHVITLQITTCCALWQHRIFEFHVSIAILSQCQPIYTVIFLLLYVAC